MGEARGCRQLILPEWELRMREISLQIQALKHVCPGQVALCSVTKYITEHKHGTRQVQRGGTNGACVGHAASVYQRYIYISTSHLNIPDQEDV